MRRKNLLVVLTVLVVLLSCAVSFAAVEKTPGVPKSASLVYTVSFDAAHKEALGKYSELIMKNPDFAKMTEAFAKKVGTDFPKGILEKAKNVDNFSMVFAPSSNPKEPMAGIIVTFDNDKMAAETIAKLKEKFASIYKNKYNNEELSFVDSDVNGVKVNTAEAKDKSKDHFKNGVPQFAISDKTVVFVVQKKDDSLLKSIVSALKDEKETLATSDNFKAALAKVGKTSNSIFFLDPAFIKAVAADDQQAVKFAEAVNFFAVGSEISGDLSKVVSNSTVSLKEVKDKAIAEKIELIKMVVGNIKRDVHPSAVVPADAILLFDLKLNLTKELFTKPEFAMAKEALKGMQIDLDEEILSWLDGGIFVALGDIANVKDLKEKNLVPDFYAGLKCANAEKFNKFLDKMLTMAKLMMASQADIKDETIANVKVKVIEMKDPNAPKNLVITFGVVDKYILIASNKGAFEKAASVKAESALASNAEFKALGTPDMSSFISYYMNGAKVNKLTAELSPVQLKQNFNEMVKSFQASASIKDNDITGTFMVTSDPSKLTPEFISGVLSSLTDQFMDKAAATSPSLVVPAEEKKDEKPAEKVEEKKDEKSVEKVEDNKDEKTVEKVGE